MKKFFVICIALVIGPGVASVIMNPGSVSGALALVAAGLFAIAISLHRG